MPSVLIVAFGIVAMLYVTISWFGERHLSPEAKEELSLWLWGEYESSWQKQFGRLFDSIFGIKHFTLRCFLISSMFSMIAVTLVYSLIGERIGIGGRPLLPIAFVIFIIIINSIIDYVSLIETRMVLRWFQNVQSVPGQIGLLVVDAIATAGIGLGFIFGAQVLLGSSDDPQKPIISDVVGVVVALDPRALILFSTFFTSVWLWIFVVSTLVVRIVSKRSVSKTIDVGGTPHRQLALVGAAVVFVPALIVSSIVSLPSYHATFFDDHLCGSVPRLCVRIAGNSESSDRKKSLLSRGCSADHGYACFELAEEIGDAPNDTFKTSDQLFYYERSCELDLVEGCFFVGLASRDNKAEYQGAKNHFEKTCRDGLIYRASACLELAKMTYRDSTPSDRQGAIKLFEQSCGDNVTPHPVACLWLSWLNVAGEIPNANTGTAKHYLELACRHGLVEACRFSGSNGELADKNVFRSRFDNVLGGIERP